MDRDNIELLINIEHLINSKIKSHEHRVGIISGIIGILMVLTYSSLLFYVYLIATNGH